MSHAQGLLVFLYALANKTRFTNNGPIVNTLTVLQTAIVGLSGNGAGAMGNEGFRVLTNPKSVVRRAEPLPFP